MEETSSPKVVPSLTKTDAKELKALVRRDNQILLEDLAHRAEEFLELIKAESWRRKEEITKKREGREAEVSKTVESALRDISRQISKVNELIVATMTGLAEAGWRHRGRYGDTVPIQPHDYTVVWHPPNIQPPGISMEDLDEAEQVRAKEIQAMREAVLAAHTEAKRHLVTREAEMLRDLTLQSITTEAAKEFILSLPRVEDLLPLPPQLEAIGVSEAIEAGK